MDAARRYFKRLAYSGICLKPSKNRCLRKDRRYGEAACLSRKEKMPVVHKQKFD
jgi:hypothetical protein